MNNDKNTSLVFVVDASGSMLGQPIGSVNAALAECKSTLSIESNKSKNVFVTLATFTDVMNVLIFQKPIKEVDNLSVSVTTNNWGLYNISDYEAFYYGVDKLVDLLKSDYSCQAEDIHLYVLSDTRSINSDMNNPCYKKFMQRDDFKELDKYAVTITQEADSTELLRFVDGDKSRIIDIEDFLDIIRELIY